MIAKSLMVGDWVFTRGEIEQVTSIYDGYICTEHYEDSHDYYFEPIPITPEILEKNGFEKQGFPGWEIYTEDFLILWRNDYPDVLEIRCFNAAYGSFRRSHISYVHELQHALRLCGIEKEIVL